MCATDFELYVNSTAKYLTSFTSVCRYGRFDDNTEEFPICLESKWFLVILVNKTERNVETLIEFEFFFKTLFQERDTKSKTTIEKSFSFFFPF